MVEKRAVEDRLGPEGALLRIKADWRAYYCSLRRREIEMIFTGCPPKAFSRGLELGAGAGFQSHLLSRYVVSLDATDYATQILTQPDGPGLTHRVCDAERVDEVFARDEFDLVFSSNVMEHLPEPQRALNAMRHVLRDDGVAVHIMPSPFWKLSQMAGFYPNAIVSRVERYGARCQVWRGGIPCGGGGAQERNWDNNPKVTGRRPGYWRRLLWPTPHGVAESNLREFAVFRPAYWRQQFCQAGFRVAAVLRGPVTSSYGFGLDRLRTLLERLSLTSEYFYVTTKAGSECPNLPFLISRRA